MTPPTPVPGNVKADDPVQAIAEDLALATQHYEKAIGQLDALAKSSGGALDPAIAQVLQQNLAAVDKAIDESRGAVKTSPDNVTARESLIEALRRKVDVLQATVSLMGISADASRVPALSSLAPVLVSSSSSRDSSVGLMTSET